WSRDPQDGGGGLRLRQAYCARSKPIDAGRPAASCRTSEIGSPRNEGSREMTVVSRRIVSTPARSASASWDVIVQLVTAPGSTARQELQGIEGIASCIIAEESLKTDPCVVFGSGPRVRIYCLYNEDAIAGEDANETVLTFMPTEGDW